MASLPDLLEHQRGLLLRRQALALGITDSAIEWRVACERWQRVLPGLIATFPGPPSGDQRLTAACLYAGEDAQITGPAALRWHGARYVPGTPWISVLVPAERRRTSTRLVRIHRTTRPDTHTRSSRALTVCGVARAAADTARAGHALRDVRAVLADVVQRGLTTAARLDTELRAGPVRGSATLRRVLVELMDGVRSSPEAELRDLAYSSSALPPIRWNPRLVAADGTALPCPDGWIQDVGIALESNSREFHAHLEGWERTLDRATVLGAHGVLTLHFTPAQVREKPRRVLALIEQACGGRPPGFDRVRVVDGKSST